MSGIESVECDPFFALHFIDICLSVDQTRSIEQTHRQTPFPPTQSRPSQQLFNHNRIS